jgi:hypothetical protein
MAICYNPKANKICFWHRRISLGSTYASNTFMGFIKVEELLQRIRGMILSFSHSRTKPASPKLAYAALLFATSHPIVKYTRAYTNI